MARERVHGGLEVKDLVAGGGDGHLKDVLEHGGVVGGDDLRRDHAAVLVEDDEVIARDKDRVNRVDAPAERVGHDKGEHVVARELGRGLHVKAEARRVDAAAEERGKGGRLDLLRLVRAVEQVVIVHVDDGNLGGARHAVVVLSLGLRVAERQELRGRNGKVALGGGGLRKELGGAAERLRLADEAVAQ